MPSSAGKKKMGAIVSFLVDQTMDSNGLLDWSAVLSIGLMLVTSMALSMLGAVLLELVAYLFFFNDTPPTEIYTLSLPDALPIASPFVAAALPSASSVLTFSRVPFADPT